MKFAFENTPENQSFFDLINLWSKSIPTCYFLDICCVSNIRESRKYLSNEMIGTDKYKFIKFLETLDFDNNAISYLPALMEKTSDLFNDKSVNNLTAEVREDLEALHLFFKNAKVIESPEFSDEYINKMKSYHPEMNGQGYHDFLSFVNCSGIIDAVSKNKRLGYVKSFCEQADLLNIEKNSVVVISAIACIYGCIPARKVMKFKREPGEFNSSNALADLQSVSRVARMSNEIERGARLGLTPYVRYSFITEDKNLNILYDCFFVNGVEQEITENFVKNKITMTIEGKLLFPELFKIDGSFTDASAEDEFVEVLKYLGLSTT
ncbi:hypothetical protein GZ59_16500 [Pectobacterium atrosepticum]|nr:MULTISPECIES: hypothetical protein [Pectobacterium]AIK13479.1 hypothetical protein GZ59_16500 [Pectobacterium atrosepticum]MBG0751136.1 hypothetical protein [Pectobacterium carotovorum subsp. carotovorum PCCS1]